MTVNVDNSSDATEKGALLADRAHAHLREQIISGRLAPGARLSEVEIARQVGVSRGPVREAIRRLVASGLATQAPNQSARVIELDEQRILSVYDVREAIESMAAACAAERMTEAERTALDDLLTAHSSALGDVPDSYPSGPGDWDFHHLVLTGSRNSLAYRICVGDLRDLLALLRAGHRNIRGRGERALLEHRWIANAIIAGQADLARTLMATHIRASRDGFLRQWRERNTAATSGRQAAASDKNRNRKEK